VMWWCQVFILTNFFSDLKNLFHFACQIHAMFFSTYLYVHFFSTHDTKWAPKDTGLTDTYLSSIMTGVVMQNFKPDINKLSTNRRCQFSSSLSHLQYYKLACNCNQQYNFNINIRCSEYVGTCFDPHLGHFQASIEHKCKLQLHA